jgi:hypothetical protein
MGELLALRDAANELQRRADVKAGARIAAIGS